MNYLNCAVNARKLHPMLALSIGRKFDQRLWLQDALTNVQRMPISTWIDDPTILSWMSPHDMTIALRLRENFNLSRLELICFRPDAVHAPGCWNQQVCSFHWELSWALSVVPRIAHKTYKPVDLFLFIKELVVDEMGKGCAEASREAALATNRFYTDLRGVEKALELV